MTANVPVKAIAWGVTVATAMFAGLGTAAALWENPLFTMALGGVALLAVAIWIKLTRRDCIKAGTQTGSVAS